MGPLRICLVTPFSWSQPHDVNEHVAGLANGLRELGHSVTVLAPSGRAADLLAGRRALQDGLEADLIALGPALPISRRSRIGVPVGVRANLALALARGRFDVVHGFEPGLPSLSYLALLEARALSAATFFSPERLGYPPSRAQRERLLGRTDALLAVSDRVADAAAERFPGDYRVVSPGVDLELFVPGEKRKLAVVEWRPGERTLARTAVRVLPELPGWELVILRTKPLSGRPTITPSLRDRVRLRTLRDGRARAALFAETAIFLPSPNGLARVRLEAQAAGTALADPPGLSEQPELGAAALARLAENDGLRERVAGEARALAAGQDFADVAAEHDELYRSLAAGAALRARVTHAALTPSPTANGSSPTSTCTPAGRTTARSRPPTCSTTPTTIGLGAIAVTDHNVFGGALEAVELAEGRDLIVIPGEEIKTDGQGEVIGLFLSEEIPRRMSFADTVAAIKEQGGLVYLPHPFDRMHTVPDPSTLHRHLADIDVFEVYNARLLLEGHNDEALRFARKYNLTMGAGSDAHVLQGVGTGVVRMRAFRDPEEFLISLRSAEVLRRPKSLAYLQSLKWMAQVKERVR